MSLKSSWIFHGSSWVFLKAACIKITSVKKKKSFGKKERLKTQQYANVPGDHESVFYDFNVPGIVYFPLFEVLSWGKVLK